MINEKAFTLVELLVVIAIIGLLSTIAIISLTSAGAKSRDTVRLADMRNVARILSLAASNDDLEPLVAPCNAGTPFINTCIGAQPDPIGKEFPKFKDPKGTAVCDRFNPAICNYTIEADINHLVGQLKVLFYLEYTVGDLAGKQVHWIDSSGAFDQP